MSASWACQCPERQKPVKDRDWVVVDYKCNYSAFNGYHFTPSDYSAVKCRACLKWWRTKAKYVAELKLGSY